MTGPDALTVGRRRYLATLGVGVSSVFAGCSLLEDDDPPTRFDAEEIDPVFAESVPEVDRPAPVDPAEEAIDGHLERAEELLETLPEALGVENVPNGVVREAIDEMRGDALEGRDDVVDATAPTRFEALWNSRTVREDAREAHATYLAVGEDTEETWDDLEEEQRTVRDDVTARLEDLEYVGEDEHRSALLYYRLENDLEAALRSTDRPTSGADVTVLDLGERAGSVEHARATVDVVSHLEERHRDRLEDPSSVENRLETALERAIADLEEYDLPNRHQLSEESPAGIDQDAIQGTPAGRLLHDASLSLDNTLERLADDLSDGRVASGLQLAFDQENRARTAEVVYDRLEDGAYHSLEDPETIWEVRDRTIERVETLAADLPETSIPADVFARRVDFLEHVNDDVRRLVDEERSSTLTREYARYLWIDYSLATFGDATATFETWLEVG